MYVKDTLFSFQQISSRLTFSDRQRNFKYFNYSTKGLKCAQSLQDILMTKVHKFTFLIIEFFRCKNNHGLTFGEMVCVFRNLLSNTFLEFFFYCRHCLLGSKEIFIFSTKSKSLPWNHLNFFWKILKKFA